MRWSQARQRTLADGTLALLPAWSTLVWTLFPVVGLAFPLIESLTSAHDGFAGRGFVWFFAVLLAFELLLVVLIATRRRILLRPDRLSHRNLGRWHDLPAAEIQAVTLSGDGLTQTIQVWTRDRLSHRIAGITPVDITVVGDWWLAHRGSDWQPAWTPYPSAPTPVAWWT